MSAQTETVVRLSSEFGPLIPAAVINEVVTQCDHDLSGTPNTARPEMLERLARQRLAFLDRPVAWIN
jgi:hypothetical protein